MIIGSEFQELKDTKTYLIDTLRLALSISPNSVPCNSSLGVELRRVSYFEDITRIRIDEILKFIDPNGMLEVTECSLHKGVVTIGVKLSDTDEEFRFSLNERK